MSAARWGAAVLGGVVIAALTGELAVRALHPAPRTQLVRADAQRVLRTVRSVPAWQRVGDGWPETLVDPGCEVAGGRRVVFTGDSILQVTGARAADNFVVALRQRMPGWCLHVVAEAGFIGEQKLAVALDALDRWPVDAVVWEVWGERGHAVQLDDRVWHVGGYRTDAEGWPVLPGVPLPDVWNRALLRNSALWTYAVLALGATEPFAPVRPLFDDLLTAARAEGAVVLLAEMPELERPFGEPSPVFDEVKAEVRAWAAERGVVHLDVGAAWAGRLDHEAVRLDPCCHYNPAGHAALADLFEGWLREHVR